MKGALDVHRELLARDVPHEMVRLRGRALSSDDLPRLLGLTAGCVTVRCYDVAVHVDADGGSRLAAVLLPAGRVPQPQALLDALGARAVSPASEDTVNAVTEYSAGLVAPFCLPPEVVLLADTALGASEVSYCAVGEGGVALGIRTRDLLVATGARVATLTGPAPADELGLVLDLDAWTGSRTAG